MKSEEFDNAIRAKLSELNFETATDLEVNSVLNYTQLKNRKGVQQKRFLYVGVASTVLTFIGLVWLNIYQFNTHKVLLSKIERMKQTMKRMSTYNQHSVSAKPNENELKNSSFTQTFASESIIPKKNQVAINLTNTSNKRNGIEKDIQSPMNETSEELTKENSPSLEATKTIAIAEAVNRNSIINTNEITEPSNPEKNKFEVDKPKVIIADTSRILEEGLTPSIAQEEHKFNPLKNFTYGLGAFSEIANHYNSFGAMAIMHFNTKLSIALGITSTQVGRESFHTEDEFHNRKGHTFRDTYAMNTQDSNAISNIDIRYKLVQLPLRFMYKLNTIGKLQYVIAVGTDIDIHAKQKLNFRPHDTHNGSDVMAQQHLQVNNGVLMINNFVLSAGLEKSFKHFFFQAMPFVATQMRRVSYKSEMKYFGCNLNVFYHF